MTKPLSGIFKHAMRRGLTSANPVTLLTSDERPRDEQTERPYEWSPESIQAVIGAARRRAQKPSPVPVAERVVHSYRYAGDRSSADMFMDLTVASYATFREQVATVGDRHEYWS